MFTQKIILKDMEELTSNRIFPLPYYRLRLHEKAMWMSPNQIEAERDATESTGGSWNESPFQQVRQDATSTSSLVRKLIHMQMCQTTGEEEISSDVAQG